MTPAEKVLCESERFRAALPDLLQRYEGKWVVFKEGAVVADFDDEDAAYSAAVETFGPEGGFVVAEVVEQQDIVLSASVYFCRPLSA